MQTMQAVLPVSLAIPARFEIRHSQSHRFMREQRSRTPTDIRLDVKLIDFASL
jgi:hypothetical protein